MSRWHRRLKRWVSEQLVLPNDVLLDLPRITMIGQLHIYIENHRGVLKFSDREIRLLLSKGQLLMKGSGFVIKNILPEELLIEGKIDEVFFLSDRTS